MQDPFTPSQLIAAVAALPEDTPAKAVSPSSEGKVVLTFKGGTGYDAPWIVIHAKDLDDARGQVSGDNAAVLADIMEKTQQAGRHFASLSTPKTAAKASVSPAPASPSAPPAGAQEAPGGEKRYCSHGEMRFRSAVSKAGKPYKGFFCAETDRDSQCQAQFLR